MSNSAAQSQLSGTIVIVALGTQGDIRPVLALAVALQQRGHRVRFLTSVNFATMVRHAGIDFYPLDGNFQQLLTQNPKLATIGLNWVAMWRLFRNEIRCWAQDWATQALMACQGASLLIGVGITSLLAKAVSEKLSIEVVYAQLQPLTPSRYVTPMLWPGQSLPCFVSAAAYDAIKLLTWRMVAPAINTIVRPQLGLPAYPWYGPYFSRQDHSKVLYGYSECLFTRPPDWPDTVQVCGYWHLNQPNWQPDRALERFLAAGPPPLYIGFGSMPNVDPVGMTKMVMQAVRLLGQRAVLAQGWGGLAATEESSQDERFISVDHVPHDWLLPKVAAAVHHGGAGTTGAVISAGIPSVVVPFYGDQPFWAHCLTQRNVAPPPLAWSRLDPNQLAEALVFALKPQTQKNAQRLGKQVRLEDGLGTAITHLARWGLIPGDHADKPSSLQTSSLQAV